MTQQSFDAYLYDKLCKSGAIVHGSPLASKVYQVLKQELSEHVCIKKGENRHPYADVLHEWLEGTEIEVKLDGEWTDYMCSLDYIKQYEYRIKPQEPVYEWQWITFRNGYAEIRNEASFDGEHQYFTENEVNQSVWRKLEETKRERKQ